MFVGEVVVALSRSFERFHFIGGTLEAHANAAPAALDLEATGVAHYKRFAFPTDAFSYALVGYVVFEEFIF